MVSRPLTHVSSHTIALLRRASTAASSADIVLTHSQSDGSSTGSSVGAMVGVAVSGTTGASVGTTGLGVGATGASVGATGLGVSGKMPKGAAVKKSVGEPVGLLVTNSSSHVMQISCCFLSIS